MATTTAMKTDEGIEIEVTADEFEFAEGASVASRPLTGKVDRALPKVHVAKASDAIDTTATLVEEKPVEAAPKVKVTKAAPKVKVTKAAPKVKEPKVVKAKAAKVEPDKVPGKYVGMNDFGSVKATGKSSSEAIWNQLLTKGSAKVSLSSEFAPMLKAETDAAKQERKDMISSAKNRIGQRLTQPYQAWYPVEKATGVFSFEEVGSGAAKGLMITYMDDSRPPLLVSNKGRITLVGKVVLEMIAKGTASFSCGITDAMVAELVEVAEGK